METRFYDDIEEFYEVAYPFLLEHEAENNLPLSILNSLKKNVEAYGEVKPLLFSLTDAKIIKLIVLRTPPHDLIISYTDNLSTIDVLTEELIKQGETLPGVLRFKEAADKFAEQWCVKNVLKCELFRKERIYMLEKISEETLGHRKFSVAPKVHQELVFQWAGEMMKEALIDTTEDDILRMVNILREEFEQGKSHIYLLFENDEPVSMAKEAGKTPNGVFVNLVYTPIPLRRKGYATECVAKLSKLLLEVGNTYCFLFTDLSNPTSNSIYQKIGYRPVIDENHYKFLEK
ncbi:MAG TPA: GNAT family N-acetyltransferase [Candidatus Nanopelagicaceae bacterium]|nr:GNAT family N-acetyltransferase [Candidatus Nanopelagicaceae bacterium]